MTKAQQKIVKYLLTGHFIRTQRRGKKTVCVLYDAKINPVIKIRYTTFKSLTKLVPEEIELLKQSKKGDISINLSEVRKLHGNHTIKKLYKQRDQLQTTGTIYKTRQSRKKVKDEKVCYLF